ncbi:HARB1-like protein [Mya arenaria]|uniref:HARB1-like protein n=1 Tax=Mya arenaria TaxID=6604 RepID=A0ABY7GEJ8_MYAAR|nr:HARB1-like protein [Mya arenaria]
MAANNHQPNVFDIYNGRQLLERYRLDREGIEFLEAELNQFIGVATRNRSMTVTEKILITLRYLATGGIQLNDGDIHYVSQPSVSRATLHDTKSDFYGIAGFPNVIGVIDGTHVQIKAPLQDEPAYVNRMGYHSINTQFKLFYSAHKTTRSRVERGIGQLKRRWGILNGEIGLKPEKACKVIIACAVLHNICKRRNIPLFDILPNAAGQGMNQGVYAGPQEGLRYRECVAQSFF